MMFRNAGEQSRGAILARSFEEHFAAPATFLVRAPGRVNLLGEHTDYNGLPVLPMAIERSVMIAGRARTDRSLSARNGDQRFPPRDFALADSIPPFAEGDWGNYLKAAAQDLVRQASISSGADLLVDGNVPSGAGLSSSSALVVATTLAILAANRSRIPPAQLAARLPMAEQYVGTLSGGMDQAISLLAQAGSALRIDFFPLRCRPVALPAGCAIVVCHSLVAAEKSGAARQAYNQRVIECRLACRVLDRSLGPNLPRPLSVLGDLSKLFPGRPLRDFLPHLTQTLPEGPIDLETVATAIGTDCDRLVAQCEIPAATRRFTIVERARHVLSEADRVDLAEAALRSSDIERFGELMDASHASCRDDYEISCTEIERLVHLAKEGGALGARVTGAGFGGCTVNLLRAADVDRFLGHMDRTFYDDRVGNSETAGYRFVFHPQVGAEVVLLG